MRKLNSQHNALTRPLRTAAAKQGRAEFLSLWAGQGVLRAVDVIYVNEWSTSAMVAFSWYFRKGIPMGDV